MKKSRESLGEIDLCVSVRGLSATDRLTLMLTREMKTKYTYISICILLLLLISIEKRFFTICIHVNIGV